MLQFDDKGYPLWLGNKRPSSGYHMWRAVYNRKHKRLLDCVVPEGRGVMARMLGRIIPERTIANPHKRGDRFVRDLYTYTDQDLAWFRHPVQP